MATSLDVTANGGIRWIDSLGNTIAKMSQQNGMVQFSGLSADSVYAISVKNYGAKGDGVTNDTTSINSAIAALLAAGGGVLYFPPGVYIVSSPINIVTPDNGFPSARVKILGSGAYCTQIKGSFAGNLMNVVGGNGGNSHNSMFCIEDICLFGNNLTAGSVGINFLNCAFVGTRYLFVTGFDLGIGLQGCEKVFIGDGTLATYNNKGLLGNINGGVSGPNSYELGNCSISQNGTYGVYLQQGTSCLVRNSCFEYNGPSSQAATSWGFRLDDFGSQNSNGVVMINPYFEGNGGIADLLMNNTNGIDTVSTNSIINGEFMRIDASKYTQNNILLQGSKQINVHCMSSAFVSAGNYVPNAANKCWLNQNTAGGGIYDNHGSNTFLNAIEKGTAFTDAMLASTALNLQLSTPATSSAPGNVGDIKVDSGYVYVCTAANTWKRAALATF